MTVVDLLASNDILRGLDVLIQRQKAIELAADQGSWAQAQYLELTHADEEHSYFRQELKAVQAERKADLKLQQMAWAPRGWKGEWKGGKGQPKRRRRRRRSGDRWDSPLERRGRSRKMKRPREERPGEMEEVKQDQRLLPEVLTPLVNEIMEGASADRKDVRSQRVKAILESNRGKEPPEIANVLTRKYHELYSESAPDEMVCAREGCRSDHHVEGPEAGRHHGVIIRWVSGEWLQWRSDGGIYVGDGSKRLTASPLGQANRDRLDTRVARRLLEGRPLYIDEGDSLEMAQSTVDYFGLRGGTGQGPRYGGREYYQQVEAFVEGAMTTLQLKIVLKVRVRPSLLGTAVILMELCAVGPLGSSQPFQEVLPLPLPDDTEAEIEVRRVLEKVRLGQPEAGS